MLHLKLLHNRTQSSPTISGNFTSPTALRDLQKFPSQKHDIDGEETKPRHTIVEFSSDEGGRLNLKKQRKYDNKINSTRQIDGREPKLFEVNLENDRTQEFVNRLYNSIAMEDAGTNLRKSGNFHDNQLEEDVIEVALREDVQEETLPMSNGS